MSAATLNSLATGWSTLMLAVLWQAFVLVLVVALVIRLVRIESPTVRYWLWQIVAIKLLLMPLWAVVVPVSWWPAAKSEDVAAVTTVPPTENAPPSVVETPAVTPLEERPTEVVTPPAVQLSWPAWLMIAWAIVVLYLLTMVVWKRLELSLLLKRTSAADPEIESLVKNFAAQFALGRVPRVAITDDVCSPFVCGLFRSTLVLPRVVMPMLTTGQLAPVLAHELVHLKRRDLIWGWIPQIARQIYFFHPAVHWVAYMIYLEAELACDGLAMATTGQSAKGYSKILVRVLTHLSLPGLIRAGKASPELLDAVEPLPDDVPDTERDSDK